MTFEKFIEIARCAVADRERRGRVVLPGTAELMAHAMLAAAKAKPDAWKHAAADAATPILMDRESKHEDGSEWFFHEPIYNDENSARLVFTKFRKHIGVNPMRADEALRQIRA